MIVKYEIERHVINPPNAKVALINVFEKKIISKKNLKVAQSEGWRVVRRRYFILTGIADWWSQFDMNQKISITGIVVGSIISLLAIYFGFIKP